jgi:hypothetical protein
MDIRDIQEALRATKLFDDYGAVIVIDSKFDRRRLARLIANDRELMEELAGNAWCEYWIASRKIESIAVEYAVVEFIRQDHTSTWPSQFGMGYLTHLVAAVQQHITLHAEDWLNELREIAADDAKENHA